MKTKMSCTGHPMLLFWLGVLTGAVIVGLSFLYRLYALDMQAAVLRNYYSPTVKTTTSTLLKPTYKIPTTGVVSSDDPDPWMPL